MTPYPIVLQQKMTRLHGHLFLVPGRLAFLCSAKGGAWAQAVGQGVGGAIGGAIAAAAGPKTGALPQLADEAALDAALASAPGSFALTPAELKLVKYSLWTGRAIVARERTWGFPTGLSSEGAKALGAWARAHGVVTKGKALGGA